MVLHSLNYIQVMYPYPNLCYYNSHDRNVTPSAFSVNLMIKSKTVIEKISRFGIKCVLVAAFN